MLKSDGQYARLLNAEFPSSPPAFGIRSRDDYDTVLTMLNGAIGRPAQGTGQLGLFATE